MGKSGEIKGYLLEGGIQGGRTEETSRFYFRGLGEREAPASAQGHGKQGGEEW